MPELSLTCGSLQRIVVPPDPSGIFSLISSGHVTWGSSESTEKQNKQTKNSILANYIWIVVPPDPSGISSAISSGHTTWGSSESTKKMYE